MPIVCKSRRIISQLWISALLLNLLACSTSQQQVLPQDGPSMRDVYEQHFGLLGDAQRDWLHNRVVQPAGLDTRAYTREAYNEIEQLFPQLPNPTLVMYVFPHLAGPEGLPIPGYATAFPMYEKAEYALPGEIAARPLLAH